MLRFPLQHYKNKGNSALYVCIFLNLLYIYSDFRSFKAKCGHMMTQDEQEIDYHLKNQYQDFSSSFFYSAFPAHKQIVVIISAAHNLHLSLLHPEIKKKDIKVFRTRNINCTCMHKNS